MPKDPAARPRLEEIAARPGVNVPWDRITTNEWKPDTCADPPRDTCLVEQWFDDDDPTTVLWARSLSTCTAHATASLDEGLWQAVRGENSRKNRAFDAARGLLGGSNEAVWGRVTWSFDDAQRVTDGLQRFLTITVARISPAEQQQIQSIVDVRFGPGLITIERG